MEKTREESPSVASESGVQEHHSLNAVRDLLFGSQSREINERINRLEQALNSSISEVETRLSQQFESLEKALRGELGTTREELGSARQTIDANRTELEQRDSANGEEVKQLGATLNDRFSELSASIERIESEGRLLLFERLKSLKDEIGETTQSLTDRLESELSALRDGSTSRHDLGQRLIELGQAFSGESKSAPADPEVA
ncbi:MAG: hypothetical protein KDL87_14115 [Verrucomicrobiae bacterium]|nr:hypothetical protein [Verrucomicrobiae bacterium]